MKMTKGLAKTVVLTSATAHLGLITYTAHADDWQQIGKKDQILDNKTFDLGHFINSGKTIINEDAGVIETKLTAQEAAVSPMTKLTQNEPLVMGIFDGANDIGTIQVINMKRHPDGSATLYQRFFTPHDFDPKGSGGQLSPSEFSIIQNRYGGNPFDNFKSPDNQYKNAFIKIKPEGLQTAMGLAMQRYGSSFGMFAFLEPQVRTWTTTSGNAFRKKVTTHVEAHFKPHWYMLTPADAGSGLGNIAKPFYVLENRKTVLSGVNLHVVEENTSNVSAQRVKVFYDKKTKSAWTGISMVVVGIALGALTGGMGMFAMMGMATAGGAVIGGMAVAGFAFINGNKDLADPVTTSLGNVTAVSDTKSLEVESDWTMEWKNVMRDKVNAGPLDGDLGSITSEFNENKNNWEALTVSPK